MRDLNRLRAYSLGTLARATGRQIIRAYNAVAWRRVLCVACAAWFGHMVTQVKPDLPGVILGAALLWWIWTAWRLSAPKPEAQPVRHVRVVHARSDGEVWIAAPSDELAAEVLIRSIAFAALGAGVSSKREGK